MTSQGTIKLLIPEYMKYFACIGSECEDTCCAGWSVSIDKATYKKYKKTKDKELSKQLDQNVVRNRKNPTDNRYAKIKMKEDLSCPFLNETKLCNIQLNLGESYLSYTCKTYPRTFNTINGVIEKAATLSCPEAARLALLNPEKMSFTHADETINIKDVIGNSYNFEDPRYANSIKRFFWDLRVFTIQVLQSREYKLWERLSILGIFYQTVQEYQEENKLSEIPELINEYVKGIEQGAFDQALQDIPANEFIQLNILTEILLSKKESGGYGERFLAYFTDFTKGVNPDNLKSLSGILKNYISAYQNYYQPFMEKHEYILENYLVNYVFKTLFPFNRTKNLFDNYVLMIAHYSLIKMLLIGLSGYHKENFDPQYAVGMISAVSKNIEHSDVFINKIVSYIQQKGFNTLSHMLLLIKN
ncbi:flagellin lysine-N-methylase [Brevibacillus composti]|uniref:Flagellin lysine-N-methylase n=1 Tax=Brevibacillus composti TaxID=2796470 RepID=A0A7T5EK56_9BACL|nr:flagellin lysine-N-methylase [Brevibacillus composti]QQE74109.1 flagellin lysine-N-methylase [Brevibacillus composti]QUO41193.1 flagellin lysine-N-methylase [Brevibacillus composti]